MMAWHVFTSRRVVLFAGFGGLLAIVSLMAWKSARVISVIEPETIRLHSATREQTRFLDTIRFGLSESATEIRDYLLDRDPAGAGRRRSEFLQLQRQVNEAVARYGRALPAGEESLWQRLREGIAGYWSALEPALGWDPETRLERGETFLQTEVFPRRRELVALAATVVQVDERNFRRHERDISDLFAQFRNEMAASAILSVVLSVILAVVTVRRILDLGRAAERHLAEVAQARAELQRLSQRLVGAQEEERRLVARELHDEVGQAISAVLVEIGRLESRLPDGQAESRAALASAHQLADRAVAQVRDMALLLRPSMLDDLGLAPALKWQAREIARRSGIQVKVAAEEAADELPDEHRTCIYRVVQEALNNAARHARATSVRVDVQREETQVRVSIQDDGAGFDPAGERGMGILGMEERVKNLGGVFRIDSKKGGGTIVSLLLPLGPRAAEAVRV